MINVVHCCRKKTVTASSNEIRCFWIFCLALLRWDLPALVAPSTLVFYGLALVNGSKHTLRDVEFLGLTEIALGLAGLFYLGNGLELWTTGFGLLHIVYGAWMYFKYER